MMRKPILILFIVLLIGAALTHNWWLYYVLDFLDVKRDSLRALANAIQIILWISAAVVALWYFLVGRKKEVESSTSLPASTLGDQARQPIIDDNNNMNIGNTTLGDKVKGDQTSVGNISHATGVAVGPGAQSHVTINCLPSTPIPFSPPLMRPPRIPYFQGRESELAQLLDNLQPGNVITICGPGGMGKTALATEVVWALASGDEPPKRFPDGIFFHSFYNQPDSNVALEQIVLAFGGKMRGTPQAAAQHVLSRRIALLVFDGTEVADDLRSVLNVRNRCGVLMTSRKMTDAVGSRIDISPLSHNNGMKLLIEWSQITNVNQETEIIIGKIVELTGRLPLAIRLAGRYLTQSGLNLQSYLQWLEESPLTALDQGQRQDECIPILLERSISQLSNQALSVLRVFGRLAAAPCPADAVTYTLGLQNHWDAINALSELVSHGILIHYENQLYELSHSLLHSFVNKTLELSLSERARLTAWMTDTALQNQNNLFLLQKVYPHIVRIIEHSAEELLWNEVKSLAHAIDDYLELRGNRVQWLYVAEAALTAANTEGIIQDEAKWLGSIGIVHAELGQVQHATDYFKRSMSIFAEIGDHRGIGNQLGNLGNTHLYQGFANEAVSYYQEALAIQKQINDKKGIGNQLGNLGIAHAALGRHERAIEFYHNALSIQKEINDHKGECNQLINLGVSYVELGYVQKAKNIYTEALAIAQEIGDSTGEGRAIGNMGLAYLNSGQSENAINSFHMALAIFEEIGDHRGISNQLGNLGLAYMALDRLEDAISKFSQALRIDRQIGDKLDAGIQLENLGNAFLSLGKANSAKSYYIQSIANFEEIQSPKAKNVKSLLIDLDNSHPHID